MLALAAYAAPARADAPDARLARARSDRARALAALQQTELHIAALRSAFLRTSAELEAAARDVLGAYRLRLSLSARLFEIHQTIDRRAAAVYEAGPGIQLEMLLASNSWADVGDAQEFMARTLTVDPPTLAALATEKASLTATIKHLEQRQRDLRAAARRLDAITLQVNQEVARAWQLARRAGQAVRTLERQQQRLAAALAAERAKQQQNLADLVDGERGADQSDLLRLLGPNQGRGCDIPPGLKETSVHLSGVSSWYGPGFAGRPTASGAIYDPRLFTAANKELPLNTFLRVHFQGRCAVVLMNDRGPYITGRTFDLSQAAAEYLGLGLGFVTVDVLDPR